MAANQIDIPASRKEQLVNMLDRLIRNTGVLSMAVWFVVLLFSLFIYNALLHTSLEKEHWTSAQAEARITAQNLARKLATGMRFGKDLGRYHGLDDFVARASRSSGLAVAVFDRGGKLLGAEGAFPSGLKPEGRETARAGDFIMREDDRGRAVLVPVLGSDGQVAGWAGAYIESAPLAAKINTVFARQIGVQGALSVAALFLLGVLLHHLRLRAARNNIPPQPFPRYARLTGYAVFLAVMLINGSIALHTVGNSRVALIQTDMERTGDLLTDTLNRLLMAGISLERMERADKYLTLMTAMHDGALALEIVNPQGRTVVSSVPKGTELMPDSRDFPLLNTERHASAYRAGWILRVSCVKKVMTERLRLAAMDMLTLVIIAMIFMVEISLFIKRGINVLHGERVVGVQGFRHLDTDRAGLVRPIIFGMRYAMGMTLTLIPLRTAELMPAGLDSPNILMSLPISTEMIAIGAITLLAGSWVQRQGARRSFLIGLSLLGLGYLASMAAADAGQFIASRALTGIGFGIVMLAAQLRAGGSGLVPDMYAGFYAGSVCGSAMGGMLAQQFGYMPVFLVSAVLLFFMMPFAFILRRPSTTLHTAPKQPDDSLAHVRRLLVDRGFWGFLLLILVPVAMVRVGLLQYLLPVYLTDCGTEPADIGRVYMAHCLLIIYFGPFIARQAARFPWKHGMLCIVGALSGLALLVVAICPPVPGMALAAMILGTAAAANFTAQGCYVQSFVEMRSIGVLPATCLISAFIRTGHALGPIVSGLMLPLMSVAHGTFLTGMSILTCTLLFLFLSSARETKLSS